MNVSGFATLQRIRAWNTGQNAISIVSTQPVIELNGNTNVIPIPDVDSTLSSLDANGLLNGTVDLSLQTPRSPPTLVGQLAATSLIGKGWTVTVDGTQYTLDDGGGGFWDLTIDPLGNVGTTSGIAPASASAVLSDGVGGFWELVVDITGNLGASAHAGPATYSPVLDDGLGGFWVLVVDGSGNVGATLIYQTPIAWQPQAAVVNWTDGGGAHAGNMSTFVSTAALSTTTQIIATALGLTGFRIRASSFPSLSNLDVSNNSLTTPIDIRNSTSINTFDANNNAGIPSILLSGCSALTDLFIGITGIASLDLSGCISLNTLVVNQCPALAGTIDISPCGSSIHFFDVSDSLITAINLSSATGLITFHCDRCAFDTLGVNTTLFDMNAVAIVGPGNMSIQQAPPVPPSVGPPNGIASKAALGVKGWTVTTD